MVSVSLDVTGAGAAVVVVVADSVALDWACAGKAVSATSGMVNVFGTVGREVYHGAVLNRRGR